MQTMEEMMRFLAVIFASLMIASTAAAGEPQHVAAQGESAGDTGELTIVDFPTIAKNQTRGISTDGPDPDVIIPPDETGGTGTVDPCKSGTRHLDQRCLKDINVYYCTSANAIGRQCGMYMEGTNAQICKTCIN